LREILSGGAPFFLEHLLGKLLNGHGPPTAEEDLKGHIPHIGALSTNSTVIRRTYASSFPFQSAIGFQEDVQSKEALLEILESIQEIFDVLLELAGPSGGDGQAGWTAAPAQSALRTSHNDVPPLPIYKEGIQFITDVFLGSRPRIS
jgi:hypothetical protein